jgi:hypothetical protein
VGFPIDNNWPVKKDNWESSSRDKEGQITKEKFEERSSEETHVLTTNVLAGLTRPTTRKRKVKNMRKAGGSRSARGECHLLKPPSGDAKKPLCSF